MKYLLNGYIIKSEIFNTTYLCRHFYIVLELILLLVTYQDGLP